MLTSNLVRNKNSTPSNPVRPRPTATLRNQPDRPCHFIRPTAQRRWSWSDGLANTLIVQDKKLQDMK